MAGKQTMYTFIVEGKVIPFPDVYIPYSQYIQNIQGMSMTNQDDESGSGSGSEEEDAEPGIPNITESYPIELREASEQVALALVELLKIHYDSTYSNKNPELKKKISDDKFKIEEGLGGEEIGNATIEVFKKLRSTDILLLARLSGYLNIVLVEHLCFTWMCHKLYTLKNLREKMRWCGISDDVEEPDFETILHINLKTGEIPNKDTNTSSSPVTNETDGGVGK
jgi:hypothetical protein